MLMLISYVCHTNFVFVKLEAYVLLILKTMLLLCYVKLFNRQSCSAISSMILIDVIKLQIPR